MNMVAFRLFSQNVHVLILHGASRKISEHCQSPTNFAEMQSHLSCDMRYPTMVYVRPAKAQTSLRICAV